VVTRRLPTQEEVESYLTDRRNWERWGRDDEVGAVNLITPQKCIEAAGLVRSGRRLSLSRDFPKTPGPGNLNPAQHWVHPITSRPAGGGFVQDYFGISYHGSVATHLDALCHVWDRHGMWNGRDPEQEIDFAGAKFGSVDRWSDGIVTRGVLLDIPKHRGEGFITEDRPVHGWELEEVAAAQGLALGPGDALVVYSGREAWQEAHPDSPWGIPRPSRPGLHASCLPFLRDNDVSVLVWDMLDFSPSGYDVPWTVHGAIHAYGVALLDNALLQPLAEACAEEGRYEFMLIIAPLKVAGGTGSPVNPIALL